MPSRIITGTGKYLSRNHKVRVSSRFTPAISLAIALFLSAFPIALVADSGPPVNPNQVTTRCVVLELYTRTRHPEITVTADSIRKVIRDLPGVRLKVYDLDQQPQFIERFNKIVKVYRLADAELPLVYGMNQTTHGIADSDKWKIRIHDLLRIEVFTRVGCARCDAAKRYLHLLRAKYPGLKVDVVDIISDPQANQRFAQLAHEQKMGGISVPGFWLCNKLMIGFDSEAISGPRLEAVLNPWTVPCELPARNMGLLKPLSVNQPPVQTAFSPSNIPSQLAYLVLGQLPGDNVPIKSEDEEAEALPLPIEGLETDSPRDLEPGRNDDATLPNDAGGRTPDANNNSVTVPLLGRLSADRLGMPLFTFLIGLVDGFNPCAMWVLLFLLSVLVNLQDRRKILAVAGTFVIISGAAYFAFMAAWLNVLLLVGFLRWVQVLLALLALVVGTIHVKDFFAYKKGISFSIPESAKPGIYNRVRRIVMAEHLYAAVGGAIVLAVLVNIIELLCTAGLPALYSQILTLHKFPALVNYGYLLLYISAYMLDDTLMVAIVVITLGKRKLQEHEGRWLKLFSGLVILVLGLVLLLKPEWLG